MASVDRNLAITFSKEKICKDVADIACNEAFSTVSNDSIKGWGQLILRYLATSMIEDTDGQTLTAQDRECVINKISGTL